MRSGCLMLMLAAQAAEARSSKKPVWLVGDSGNVPGWPDWQHVAKKRIEI